MFIKTWCLILVLAVMASGRPDGYYDDGNIDPGFGRYPNQGGFGLGPTSGDGHGQGGFPSQGGSGIQPREHKYGYQQYGY